MRELIDGLQVSPQRMLANLERSHGLVFSQAVLLALVASGLSRDAAYRVVQRDAVVSWEEGRPFRAVLEADPEVPLDKEALDEAFDLRRALRHAGRVFDGLPAGVVVPADEAVPAKAAPPPDAEGLTTDGRSPAS
jgi:adenylosuccinate lyase